MAQRTDIIRPINTNGVEQFDPAAMLSSISSGLVYDVTGYSSITPQISAPLDAAAAGTITVQCSQDLETWSDLPGGQVQYTTVGVKPNLTVEGLRYVRFQVTSTSGVVEFKLVVVASGGDLVVFPTPLGTRGNYGQFSANADQSIGLATATPVVFDTTEESNNVSIGATTSRITVAVAGTYLFSFRAQLVHGSGGDEVVSIWFRLNGTDISRSNTEYRIAGNGGRYVAAWSYIETLAAGDYFEIVTSATDSDVTIDFTAAGSSPTRPITPAAMLSVSQVMQVQAGPTGATGPAGASRFTLLTDAPSSYTGSAFQYTRVNTGETALEFARPHGLGYYGDGSDGAVTISSPTTLTRMMYYSSLTVSSTLTAPYRIHCSGTLTVAAGGTIQNSRTDGGAATSATGGSAGSATTTVGGVFASLAGTAGGSSTATTGTQATAPSASSHYIDNSAVNSGAGGTAPGGAGGAARGGGGIITTGRQNLIAVGMQNMGTTSLLYSSGSGAGGGGGGGSGTLTGGGGGGGGSGGGGVSIFARTIVVNSGAPGGVITAPGGSGGAGFSPTNLNTGGGGGGAGGAGGVIFLMYDSLTNNGTISAPGGTGGIGGTGNGTGASGTAGSNGATGVIYKYNLLKGIWE